MASPVIAPLPDPKSEIQEQKTDLEHIGSNDDLEKNVPPAAKPNASDFAVAQGHAYEGGKQPGFFKKLIGMGVEVRGIAPVALEDRVDRRPVNIFSFWWTASLGLLP